MSKKGLYAIAVCLVVFSMLFVVSPGETTAKTIELKFGHPNPPMHPQHVGVLVPWAKKIEEETKGAVKITFLTGGALGKSGQTYDMVEKDIANIGWDICDYTPGRFPLTTVIELPFMVKTAEQGSVALWKTYEKFPEFQKEYGDVKLLMLSTHSPGFFATVKKPIKSDDDLKGLKIKTASSFTTEALQLFGAVPVVMPITETYTALERGVVDGVVAPFDGIFVFKLHERLKYYTPADFYVLAFWVAMNKAKFESLPDDIKAVFEKNSGESFSRASGKVFDQSNAKMKQLCIEKGMQEVAFPQSEMEKLITLTAPLKDKWVKDMEAKGLPGKAVLETVTEYLK